MKGSGWKFALSAFCSMILGAGQYYAGHAGNVDWIALFFAAVTPVATYAAGFYQLNPSNQPKTKDQIITAIDNSGNKDLRAEVREAIK
jgi:hypothetical protein